MSYDGEGTPVSGGTKGARGPRLLQQVRGRLRVKHYSLRTERAYLYWILGKYPHVLRRRAGGMLSPLGR